MRLLFLICWLIPAWSATTSGRAQQSSAGQSTFQPIASFPYSAPYSPPPGPAQADAHVPCECGDELNHGLMLFFGYDAWKGLPDGGWENNGLHTGFNYGTRLGAFSELTGVGFQWGASMGVYNWSGTDYRVARLDQAQTQGFITYGFFRKPHTESRWTAGFVHDWMLNANYSVFAENPTLTQWRGQVGYAISDTNEIGAWGTWRHLSDTRDVAGFGPVTWRAIGQAAFYWQYKWEFGADSTLYFGVPEAERIAGNHSLGDYLVGALATAPLNSYTALYTMVSYMHPSASPGVDGANDEAWFFAIGLAFYPARNAKSVTLDQPRWMPLMPVANNGWFLVDTNNWF
jgi:hypothetical protein